MTKPIQTGEDALALARRFGIKGKLPLVLDEVVVPIFDLSRLDGSGIPAVGTTISGAGGAGVYSSVCLENPVGSGVLARVDQFKAILGGGALLWEVRLEGFTGIPAVIPLGSSNTGFLRDRRQFRASSCFLGVATTVGVLPAEGPVLGNGAPSAVTGGLDGLLDVQFWLPPGTRLWLTGQADNTAVRGNWAWTEFTLEPSQE